MKRSFAMFMFLKRRLLLAIFFSFFCTSSHAVATLEYSAAHPDSLAGIIDSILISLADKGYPFSRIETEYLKKDSTTSTFRLTIDSSSFCIFDKPIIVTNIRIKTKRIEHDLPIRQSMPYSKKTCDAAVEQLLSKTFIENASVSIPYVKNQNNSRRSDPDTVTVMINVDYKKGMMFDASLGISNPGSEKIKDNIVGFVNISITNQFHLLEELQLSYHNDKTVKTFSFRTAVAYPFELPLYYSAFVNADIALQTMSSFNIGTELLLELNNFWQTGLSAYREELSSAVAGRLSRNSALGYVIKKPLTLLQRSRRLYGLDIQQHVIQTKKSSLLTDRVKTFAAASVHIPTFRNQALYSHVELQSIYHTPGDTLFTEEKLKTGGHASIRGYAYQQFFFETFFFSQLQYLFYLSGRSAISLFCDPGIGFTQRIGAFSERTLLLGYGAGMQIPAGKATVSLAIARNIGDQQNLGRIHFMISNSLSSKIF